MEVRYHKRGKCSQCRDVIWTDSANTGIVDKCNTTRIIPLEDIDNSIPITDIEHEQYLNDNGYNPNNEEIVFVIV